MARTIFTNANLLDGENPAQKGTTVVVEDDRITATGVAAAAQPSDTVVDLSGLTLMPGMVSGHFHASYSDSGGNALPRTAPETKQAFWALGNAQTALRCGFTSVVSAGTYLDIDSTLAASLDSGVVEGPRMIPASQALSPSVVGGTSEEDSLYPTNSGPEAFRASALRAIKGGAKIIKVFAASGHALSGTRDMTEDELKAVVDTAHDNGARVRAHVAGRDAVLRCVHAGIDIIDHADGMDDECIEAFLAHDSFVLPSLYMPYIAAQDRNAPGADYYNPEEYEYMRGALPKAAAAGVKLVAGDDYGFGSLVHGDYASELACYVEQIGISPLEVLTWATKNGGEMTGIADLGTVAPGKLADLLIVDGDPSVDIRVLTQPERIIAVIKGGEVVSGELPVAYQQQAALAG